MISTISLATIFLVLIYRCYKMEIEVFNYKLKHNELAKIVHNNAVILQNTSNIVDVMVEEINQVLEDYSKEREGIVDGE